MLFSGRRRLEPTIDVHLWKCTGEAQTAAAYRARQEAPIGSDPWIVGIWVKEASERCGQRERMEGTLAKHHT